jgi:DNA-binding winged helix-turn-helix (wHTH) protein/TolB-like protein
VSSWFRYTLSSVQYRFGVFAFDDRSMILRRADRDVALEPQPARALALLVARADEVVSRDELRAHLWGADTHVDFDRGLAYCIAQLRSALGDSAENPRFVQTLPRRGFRFIAPVHVNGAARPDSAPAEPPSPAAPPAATPAAPTDPDGVPRATPTIVPTWIAVASIVLVILVVGAAGALMIVHDRPRAGAAPRRPILAVALFENETGDPSNDRTAAAVSDTLVERLTAIGPGRIGVNGHAPILRRPRDARDWRAVARETGAAFLVSGELQTRDGHPSLLMQLIRLDDGTHVWVQRVARPAGDHLEALDTDAAAEVGAAVRRIILK